MSRNSRTLCLTTLQGEKATPVVALRISVNDHGLVQMAALDPAYEGLMVDLMNEGMYSHVLKRTATVDDGVAFLEAVAASLTNSSYWMAAWLP